VSKDAKWKRRFLTFAGGPGSFCGVLGIGIFREEPEVADFWNRGLGMFFGMFGTRAGIG